MNKIKHSNVITTGFLSITMKPTSFQRICVIIYKTTKKSPNAYYNILKYAKTSSAARTHQFQDDTGR